MNCKPGDLAIIVSTKTYRGLIVEVIAAAPLSRFQLPDGRWHVACAPNDWIVRFPRTLRLPTLLGSVVSEWAVVSDSKLRAVSGVPVEDDTPVETNIPEALQLALGIQARVWA